VACTCCQGAPSCHEIVDKQHPLPSTNGVIMHLYPIAPVFQLVLSKNGLACTQDTPCCRRRCQPNRPKRFVWQHVDVLPGSLPGFLRTTKGTLSARAMGGPKMNPRASNPVALKPGVTTLRGNSP
jgi:hypothetical protein